MTDETFATRVRALDTQIKDLVREAFREDPPPPSGEDDTEWKARTQKMLDFVSPDHLSYWNMKALEQRGLAVRRGLSFKSFMVQESEGRRLGLQPTTWMLDQKLAAYHFVDELGVRRPEAGPRAVSIDDLSFTPPVVVKPRRSFSSKGVYMAVSEDDIVHVQDGTRFSSPTEMRAHAKELTRPGKNGRKVQDRWFAEEMILEDRAAGTPARDLKYFCFYGEVLFVLEVLRHEGRSLYSFSLPDNTPIKPGTWSYEYFDGLGTTDDHVQLVSELSKQVPHPFCRIDMLRGEDELVFGEFTPRPGRYHSFTRRWDRRMGEAWLRAQYRLEMDLLTGKSFEPFVRATRLHEQESMEPAYGSSAPEVAASQTASNPTTERGAGTSSSASRSGKRGEDEGAPRKSRGLATRVAGAASRRLPFRKG